MLVIQVVSWFTCQTSVWSTVCTTFLDFSALTQLNHVTVVCCIRWTYDRDYLNTVPILIKFISFFTVLTNPCGWIVKSAVWCVSIDTDSIWVPVLILKTFFWRFDAVIVFESVSSQTFVACVFLWIEHFAVSLDFVTNVVVQIKSRNTFFALFFTSVSIKLTILNLSKALVWRSDYEVCFTNNTSNYCWSKNSSLTVIYQFISLRGTKIEIIVKRSTIQTFRTDTITKVNSAICNKCFKASCIVFIRNRNIFKTETEFTWGTFESVRSFLYVSGTLWIIIRCVIFIWTDIASRI